MISEPTSAQEGVTMGAVDGSAASIAALAIGVFRIGLDLSIVAMLALAIAGYFGSFVWLLDMTNFFRPHIAALAFVLVLLAAISHSPFRIVAAIIVLAIAAYPLVVRGVPSAKSAESSNLRVLTANVLFDNFDTASFVKVIEDAKPDIFVVEEAAGHWQASLKDLPGYPYVVGPEYGRKSGVLIASRFPLTATLLDDMGSGTPFYRIGGSLGLRVLVDRPGSVKPLVVYGVHAPTPRSQQGWDARNTYISGVAARAKQDQGAFDVILAGDWNTPVWSPFYRKFLDEAGVIASERSAWPSPTRFFKEFGAPPVLGTPIDHIALSQDIGVASFSVGGRFGSDHLPVIADLSIR